MERGTLCVLVNWTLLGRRLECCEKLQALIRHTMVKEDLLKLYRLS